MVGRDLDYTYGFSQEELMRPSQSISMDYITPEIQRKQGDEAYKSQEDEELAEALAASIITAEREKNFSRDQDAQKEYQRRTIASYPNYEHEHLANHFSQSEKYEIEGLTEEEHLQLAILQSRDREGCAAEGLQESQYTPPTTPPESVIELQSQAPSSISSRFELVRETRQSQGYENTGHLNSPAQDPWINNPNCLYDPPPLDEQVTYREYSDRHNDSLQTDPAEEPYRTQQQVREATHERGYEWSSHYPSHHRDSPFEPTSYTQHETLCPEVNPHIHSSRPYGRQDAGKSRDRELDDATRLSSSQTSFSIIPTPRYFMPSSIVADTSRHSEPFSDERIQYIFEGPVTIIHCCRDNEHGHPDNSSATRLQSSPHNPNPDIRDFRSSEMNQTMRAMDDYHSRPSVRSRHVIPEHDRPHYSTPFLREDDGQLHPSFPVTFHRGYQPTHEPSPRNLQRADGYGCIHDDASSKGPPDDWSSPRARRVVDSPPMERQSRGHQPSHLQSTPYTQEYI